MTFRRCGILFRWTRRWSLPGSLIFAVAGLSACASATIEDAVPQSAATGAIDTGTYPNLNIVPVAETEQLTPAERDAKTAELQAVQSELLARDPSVSSDAEQLRQLAETHAEDVLEQIEE